ncbi:MAG: hypothetical protein II998_09225 [Clostridia bacterium]|nr:hypothetical protein [Clostridia bacterium]
MKPLKLEELTLEQKIGQLLMVRGFIDDDDRKFIYEMMEKRAVGAVQVPYNLIDHERDIREIKEHTDYPILIFADMENGFTKGEFVVPSALALSITGDEDLAYQFGAVTAIEAKRNGYNAIGGPVVDLLDGDQMLGITRSFGAQSNPEHVCRMTSAVLKGENDNGVLGIMKHWPNPADIKLDGHAFPDISEYSEEDLINKTLVPYKYAMENVGLGSVMTTHTYLPKIDDTYPTSMSEKIIGILRNAGFDGLLMTDSFAMLGILQKFGEKMCYGMSIKAGHDLILPNYRLPFKDAYDLLMEAYKEGIFSEERLNEAVSRVIKAQNSVMEPDGATEVSEYQKQCFEKIAKDSICSIKDDDVNFEMDKNSKKLFVLVKENYYRDGIDVPFEISFAGGIDDNNVDEIKKEITDTFQNSIIATMNQYPNPAQIEDVIRLSVECDDVIFLTYSGAAAYGMGGEFTPKLVHTMEAVADKISAIIHIGNPYPLEVVPHSPRILISAGLRGRSKGVGGYCATLKNCFSILCGEFAPKGKLPFTLNLK